MKNIDFIVAEKLTDKLKCRGVAFNDDGFPVFSMNSFADEEPSFICPWQHRNYYRPLDTALSFFMPDNLIYPRFEKIADEVDEFGKFKSVISMDLSVSRNMPLEVQKFNMLMNALYTTYLASEGIKIIPSLRCGDEKTIDYLLPYKDAPLVALGLHGCKGMSFADYDEFIFRCEMIILQPRKLLLYGKPTKAEKEILDDIGIPYRVYPDFQTLYKRGGSQDD